MASQNDREYLDELLDRWLSAKHRAEAAEARGDADTAELLEAAQQRLSTWWRECNRILGNQGKLSLEDLEAVVEDAITTLHPRRMLEAQWLIDQAFGNVHSLRSKERGSANQLLPALTQLNARFGAARSGNSGAS